MIIEGILAGVGHVVTGPDHLVGVAPLAVERERRIRPAIVGAQWGLGHGLGVAVLGILGQTLLSAAQVEVASGWAERLVGLLLIGLGFFAWRRAKGLTIHEHSHTHDGETHMHLHAHEAKHGHGKGHSHAQDEGHGHTHAAFGVGMLHGLAGAGHFWAVLPSLAMPAGTAAIYIASYILASLLIMSVFAAVVGGTARSIGIAWVPALLRAVGAITAAVGVWWTIAAF